MDNKANILFYTTPSYSVKLEVHFEDETFWLTQKRMAELFGVETNTINYHLKEIFDVGELPKESTIRNFRIVQKEGNRMVNREPLFYSLDAIISVGYRVNSQQATQFRIWATQTLKEFIIKGFVLDDERLKNGTHFGKDYFDEDITLGAFADLSIPENPVLRVVFQDNIFKDDITKTNTIQRLKQSGIEDVLSI